MIWYNGVFGAFSFMLNKEICKGCINRRYRTTSSWYEVDEVRWDNGLVHCRIWGLEDHNLYTSVYGSPPEKCPWILEHLVL